MKIGNARFVLTVLANTVGFGLIVLTTIALMHVLENLRWAIT
jgi:hypothetical protein